MEFRECLNGQLNADNEFISSIKGSKGYWLTSQSHPENPQGYSIGRESFLDKIVTNMKEGDNFVRMVTKLFNSFLALNFDLVDVFIIILVPSQLKRIEKPRLP